MSAPLHQLMTRDQRHAFLRLQIASQVLADPDATTRERRSALVTFYRGFRALTQATDSPALNAALRSLGGFMDEQLNG